VALARLVLADSGADREVVEQKLYDIRLNLILENMSSIRSQPVRTIMVPWTRVRKLSSSATRKEVLQEVANQRFSRWPVVEEESAKVVGYLLAKDLIAGALESEDWTRLVRPVRAARADDDIASTLVQIQSDGTPLCIVEEAGVPVGLITLEDILEQFVGRIEDEYSHGLAPSLLDALAAGGIVWELAAGTSEQVIRELAAAIPQDRLPAGVDVAELALARQREVSADLGVGVAIPHARCPDLARPILVFGRRSEGILFQSQSAELVRLVFLLITPADESDVQLTLVADLARIAGSSELRERLLRATSEVDVASVLSTLPPLSDAG
jgi:mannitol/fructose-specific phosphotransferase system IIA component (Ntr-type)/predicted transcriptional regulator